MFQEACTYLKELRAGFIAQCWWDISNFYAYQSRSMLLVEHSTLIWYCRGVGWIHTSRKWFSFLKAYIQVGFVWEETSTAETFSYSFLYALSNIFVFLILKHMLKIVNSAVNVCSDLIGCFGFTIKVRPARILSRSFCFVSSGLFTFDFRQFFLKQGSLSK